MRVDFQLTSWLPILRPGVSRSLQARVKADRVQGIKFEPNSFKLNHEMVGLMGGRESQGYKMFTELTVKAFLAIRPHADQLCDACHLMLGTELPSFKGEPTIKRLKDRFQVHLGERAAAEYMMGIIRNAHENMRSNVYDGFQKMQKWVCFFTWPDLADVFARSGIPY